MDARRRVLHLVGLVIGAAIVGMVIAYATGGTSGGAVSEESREAVYLDAMRTNFPDGSDADLLDVGYAVCDLYDTKSWVEVVADLTESRELSAEDAGSAATAAVALCPEHADKLP